MFKFPVIELVDRYCIALLKFNKIGTNKEELEFYKEQVSRLNLDLIHKELEQLYDLHMTVWNLEDDFKKYRVDQNFSLEEIGRRALMVRDLMQQRYHLKNRMAEILDDPVREKKNYGNTFII